jgi:hypothetical protein
MIEKGTRNEQEPCPCLVAELLEKMAAAQSAKDMGTRIGSSPGPLSPRERFWLHLGFFVLGSWNLFIINLSRSPDHLWFWPWVAGWAALLVLHLCAVLLLDRAATHSGFVRAHRRGHRRHSTAQEA